MKITEALPFVDLKAQYQEIRFEIDARIKNVLEHGQYIMGPEVEELEGRLTQITGASNCITAASGTDALLMSLLAIGISPGDEVITSPFTFASTAEVVALLGAKPVFVDVDPKTANINAHLIESKITGRTRAIIPVSLYGQPADMDAINAIAASRTNITVIEDAAQSFGASYKGRKSCNLSTIGCTSFFPSKPLGCYGDGGAVFTNDDTIAERLRELRVHGQSQRYVHTRVGICGRMDTLQCAIVLAKLTRFSWEVQRRQEIGRYYDHLFDQANIQRVLHLPNTKSIYAQYTVMVDDRENLQIYLKKRGIPTAIHYPIPLNEQAAYKKYCCLGCTPEAGRLSKHVMSIPMNPELNRDQQEYIVEAISNFK